MLDFTLGGRYNKYRCVKFEALHALLAEREGSTMSKNLEVSYLLDFYGEVLTEKQRDVMLQYYNEDLSLTEIAENFGITRQGVRDAIKRGEATLLKLEEKVGFAKRYRALQDSLEQMHALAKNIRFLNRERCGSDFEINQNADELLALVEKLEEI